jgi:homoserine kinase
MSEHLGRRRQVKVPASSANLGPGFDVLAAALGLHLTVDVVETGQFKVVTDLNIRKDRLNLVVRAFERLHSADHFEFRIGSSIPLSGGLGSSAAAIVAGLIAADHMFELDAPIFQLATELEGHPDNVAAAIYGGVVICGSGGVNRLEPPDDLEAVLVVPEQTVRTSEARAALPKLVPLKDAVANISAVAQLIVGLVNSDYVALAEGLADRLHQPYRAHLFPRSALLVEHARDAGAIGATVSGAGPTVMVWSQAEQTGPVMKKLVPQVEGWGQLMRVQFESSGAQVTGL